MRIISLIIIIIMTILEQLTASTMKCTTSTTLEYADFKISSRKNAPQRRKTSVPFSTKDCKRGEVTSIQLNRGST